MITMIHVYSIMCSSGSRARVYNSKHANEESLRVDFKRTFSPSFAYPMYQFNKSSHLMSFFVKGSTINVCLSWTDYFLHSCNILLSYDALILILTTGDDLLEAHGANFIHMKMWIGTARIQVRSQLIETTYLRLHEVTRSTHQIIPMHTGQRGERRGS